MIDRASRIDVVWLPLQWIENDAQPLDAKMIDFYAGMMRGNEDHVSPPVLNSDLTIRDGRHRIEAHRRVGRTEVRCLIVWPPELGNLILHPPE